MMLAASNNVTETLSLAMIAGTAKSIYVKLVDKLIQPSSCRWLWSNDLGCQIEEEQWKMHFVKLGPLTKSTKLRYFCKRTLLCRFHKIFISIYV